MSSSEVQEQPFSVVIVGRPNVGKSTLFNRILGYRKALVHDLPGVTRDRNIALVQKGEHCFQLVDTGGLLPKGSGNFDSHIAEQVEIALEGGDLVILVTDSKEGALPLDRELASKLLRSGLKVALAVNKVDVESHEARAAEFYALGIRDVFTVSAEHGVGTGALTDFILSHAPQPAAEPVEDEGEEATAPVRVAIIGRPNVGKSSILNRLLGIDRSIVSDVAGTTRDPVDAPVTFRGRQFLLVDTAGIRRKVKTERGAELLSVILAQRSLRQCDVALLVLDASQPPSHQDAHIAGLLDTNRKAGIVVLNKWDLIRGEEMAEEVQESLSEKFRFADHLPVEKVSALSGRRMDKLLPMVERVYRNYSQAIPTSELNRALELLVAKNSPPSVAGKELKLKYITQTGQSPPIITVFTNSRVPPPENYSRYIKNSLRSSFQLSGAPLILKFRKN